MDPGRRPPCREYCPGRAARGCSPRRDREVVGRVVRAGVVDRPQVLGRVGARERRRIFDRVRVDAAREELVNDAHAAHVHGALGAVLLEEALVADDARALSRGSAIRAVRELREVVGDAILRRQHLRDGKVIEDEIRTEVRTSS